MKEPWANPVHEQRIFLSSGDDINYRSLLRQFWLRVLLAVGIIWGVIPPITILFITRGANDSVFEVFVAIFNSLTVLPGCALAFWHRRVACIWLSVNATLILPTAVAFFVRTHKYDLGMIISFAVPVIIAAGLDFMEIRHWPNAVGVPARVIPKKTGA